ncbi:MAG TPA: MFS transporter [Trebonia sp.]|jgi:CP family cyanate transporter-like MFS transporter|nr:MFS transporter [Trebonia sp.]
MKADKARSMEGALLIVGVTALGFNLRGAITSLPPVFPELQARLHLSAAVVSVLAAAPVLCFGVVSAFAAWMARRLGEERVLLIAAAALTAGLVLRGVDASAALFPGTILAAGAIAVMNVLLSSLIKRRWPERAGLLIGIYITALSLGAIVGSLVSVPLWNATAGSVPLTLGWLAVPAVLAVAAWLPQSRYRTLPRDPAASSASRPRGSPGIYKHALAWQVTLFMGTQSLLYYATLSWLPSILRDRGESAAGAGDLLALMGVGNLAVSLIVPMLAQRMRSQRALVVPTAVMLAAGLAGAVYAPLGSAPFWVLVMGAGQNAALSLSIFFTMARAPHAAAAASLSSLAQAAGYLLASSGPLAVGLLHSATGGWNLSIGVLFALNVVFLWAGLLAARPRLLPSAPEDDAGEETGATVRSV